MNVAMMWSTCLRVLRQLKGDPRSIALILVVPALLLALVYWLYENETPAPGLPRTFDRVGLMMLGIFPFVVMFLVTSITMLRERISGTLERLLTTPLHKADLLFGYALAFSIMATLQALVATATAFWIFGLPDSAVSRRRLCRLGGADFRSDGSAGRSLGVALLSLRHHGIPSGAVHARGGLSANSAVRAVCCAGPDEHGPGGLVQHHAAELRRARTSGSGRARQAHGQALVARCHGTGGDALPKSRLPELQLLSFDCLSLDCLSFSS